MTCAHDRITNLRAGVTSCGRCGAVLHTEPAPDKTQPPPGWQWSTWRGEPEPGRVRLSGTMNTRTLEEAWADYEAEPCPYEHIVPRVTPKPPEPAPGPSLRERCAALVERWRAEAGMDERRRICARELAALLAETEER